MTQERGGAGVPALLFGAMGLVLLCSGASAASWIVPAVANVVPYGSIVFFSDITVVNSDTSTIQLTLSFISGVGIPIPQPRTFTVGPGQTRTFSNALDSIWGIQGIGAICVSADRPVAVFARTQEGSLIRPAIPGPFPALASSLPSFSESQLLKVGETGHTGWVSQSPDRTTGNRTNVGIVFPGESGGAAVVTLYDDRGTALGAVSYDVGAPTFFQQSLESYSTSPVPVGRMSVAITRGTACAYTTVVDNATGDFSILSIDRLAPLPNPDSRFEAVSSGVAQLPGANRTFWRTDARIANPGPVPTTVTAHLVGTAAAPQSAFLTVQAGQTVEIRDVVQSLFNISSAVVGGVLWRASGPLVITTRTATGGSPGSIGAAQLAVVLSTYLTAADGVAQLADLRSGVVGDAGFRTNLLAAAGPGGATYQLEINFEDGRPIGLARQILPPLGWGEFALSDLVPGVALPPRVRVQLRVEAGSLDLEAAVVDLSSAVVLMGELPRGSIAKTPTPPIPVGSWGGAPNGMNHLIVDTTSISIFRQCQGGVFPQPLWLDSQGRFAVIGTYTVSVGPALQFDAILSGQTDGRGVTVRVTAIVPGLPLLDTNPETFVLGAPFMPFTGPCPIEY